jgi:hypothetical protein
MIDVSVSFALPRKTFFHVRAVYKMFLNTLKLLIEDVPPKLCGKMKSSSDNRQIRFRCLQQRVEKRADPRDNML